MSRDAERIPPMRPKTTAIGLAGLALVGCTLTQSQLAKGPLATPIGAGGRLIAPKRCILRMMLVSRPAGDPVLNEAVWRGADPQAVDDEARRALEANGVRVGRVTGELPAEVRAVIDAPPPNKLEPMTVV